jgi:hypothetical protein
VTALLLLGALALPAYSQTGSQLGPLPPKLPQLPVVPPPAQPPAIEVPAPRPPSALDQAAKGPKIMVKDIRLVGNTAFTSQQLSEITAPYANRELTAEDLESLRLALTYYYVNHGYVTSGAVVPEQDVADGTLTMQIIEERSHRSTSRIPSGSAPRIFRAGSIWRPVLRCMSKRSRNGCA